MKRCSILLVIRKMQMKSSVRYPFIPITMAITKKKQNKITVRMWRHWEPCALLMGQQNGAAPVENSMVHLQKIQDRKTTWSRNSRSGYIPQRTETGDSTGIVHHVHCRTIHNSQKLEKSKYSLIDEGITKMYYIHIIKWNIIQPEKGQKFWWILQYG